MNILVMEDSYSDKGNLNRLLCSLLEDRGHFVVLFDGRHDGAPIRNASAAARNVVDLMLTHEVNGVVLDLHWFNDDYYAIQILRHLKREAMLDHLKIVIYSRFLNSSDPDFKSILQNEFKIPESQMFHRLKTRIGTIADQFPS